MVRQPKSRNPSGARLTNAEIADRLYISVKTAGNHVSNILTKVGVRSRTEAAAFVALHPEVLSRN